MAYGNVAGVTVLESSNKCCLKDSPGLNEDEGSTTGASASFPSFLQNPRSYFCLRFSVSLAKVFRLSILFVHFGGLFIG